MWNMRVHRDDLQEGHSGKEGESSLLIKPEREALMDGAESFKAITGQDGAKDKIKSRVSRWHALNPAWAGITTPYPGLWLL